MPLPDVLELFDMLDFLVSWRFWLSAAIGAGLGLGIFFLGGQGTVAGVIGACFGGAGMLSGIIWQFRRGRSIEGRRG
jgi:hypothetical protein